MTARFGMHERTRNAHACRCARARCGPARCRSDCRARRESPTVPVASSTRGDTNSIMPMRADRPGPRVRDADSHCPSAIAASAARTRSASVSDTEKSTYKPIRLNDVGEQARVVARRDEAAFGTHFAARQPVDRGSDLGVRQSRARRCATRRGSGDRGLCTFERRERRVAVAQARELLIVERHDAIAFAARLAEIRFLHGHLGAHARDGGAERLGVDAEQHVAGRDVARPRYRGARAGCPTRAREPRPRARLAAAPDTRATAARRAA